MSHEGDILMGTWGGGLIIYDGAAFTHYTEKEGLSSNLVFSVMEDRRGRIWVATFEGGISVLDDGEFSQSTAKCSCTTQTMANTKQNTPCPTTHRSQGLLRGPHRSQGLLHDPHRSQGLLRDTHRSQGLLRDCDPHAHCT